jgi:hypothetical protein
MGRHKEQGTGNKEGNEGWGMDKSQQRKGSRGKNTRKDDWMNWRKKMRMRK